MSATLAEKVMGRLAGRAVRAGEMVEIGPDWTFALDDGIGLDRPELPPLRRE